MKNTYRVTLAHNTSANSFYNEVASLSPDPKDIPVFKGYAYTFDDAGDRTFMCSSYRINVTEEDLNFLKLKYNFNSVRIPV
jgi:hypothetical protein